MALIFLCNRYCGLLVVGLYAFLLGTAPIAALAQQTYADLSVSAVVTPSYLVPGGRHTVELTVRNAGPDTVDSGAEFSITVEGDNYVVTHQPSPYRVLVNEARGCWAEEIFLDLVFPNNDFILLFAYHFSSLQPGESLTCTYDIQLNQSTTPPLPLKWRVTTWSGEDYVDPTPSNNTFSYTLNAAPSVPPAPVPAGSPLAWLLLGFGFVTLAIRYALLIR